MVDEGMGESPWGGVGGEQRGNWRRGTAVREGENNGGPGAGKNKGRAGGGTL